MVSLTLWSSKPDDNNPEQVEQSEVEATVLYSIGLQNLTKLNPYDRPTYLNKLNG